MITVSLKTSLAATHHSKVSVSLVVQLTLFIGVPTNRHISVTNNKMIFLIPLSEKCLEDDVDGWSYLASR